MEALTPALRTDRYLVEQLVPVHLLEVCLSNISKDDGGWEVNKAWIELLDRECFMQLSDLPLNRQKLIATKVGMVTQELLRSMVGCSTYREASLVTAIFIVKMTEDHKIANANNQGSLISALIIDENREGGDWGSYFKCQQVMWKWHTEFKRLGLFE